MTPSAEKKLHSNSTTCPHCHADLRGKPIAPEYAHYYGGQTHYSRLLGLETPGYDGISIWRCPDCGKEDSRW